MKKKCFDDTITISLLKHKNKHHIYAVFKLIFQV